MAVDPVKNAGMPKLIGCRVGEGGPGGGRGRCRCRCRAREENTVNRWAIPTYLQLFQTGSVAERDRGQKLVTAAALDRLKKDFLSEDVVEESKEVQEITRFKMESQVGDSMPCDDEGLRVLQHSFKEGLGLAALICRDKCGVARRVKELEKSDTEVCNVMMTAFVMDIEIERGDVVVVVMMKTMVVKMVVIQVAMNKEDSDSEEDSSLWDSWKRATGGSASWRQKMKQKGFDRSAQDWAIRLKNFFV
eukprot:481784-Hanusia_phi.AAC.8